MKTLNERATEILKALLAVRAYRIDHGNGVYTRLRDVYKRQVKQFILFCKLFCEKTINYQ